MPHSRATTFLHHHLLLTTSFQTIYVKCLYKVKRREGGEGMVRSVREVSMSSEEWCVKSEHGSRQA